MIPWWVNLAGVSYPGKLWKNSLNMTPRGILRLWVNLPEVSYLSKSFYFNLKFENLHKTLFKIIKILTHWLVAQADSNEKNEGRKSHWCTDVWGRSSIAFPAGVNTIYICTVLRGRLVTRSKMMCVVMASLGLSVDRFYIVRTPFCLWAPNNLKPVCGPMFRSKATPLRRKPHTFSQYCPFLYIFIVKI